MYELFTKPRRNDEQSKAILVYKYRAAGKIKQPTKTSSSLLGGTYHQCWAPQHRGCCQLKENLQKRNLKRNRSNNIQRHSKQQKNKHTWIDILNLTTIRMTLGIINNEKEKGVRKKNSFIFNPVIAWKGSKGQNPRKGVSSVLHLLSLMFCPISIFTNIFNCFVFSEKFFALMAMRSLRVLHFTSSSIDLRFGQHARNQQRSGGVWTSSVFFSLMLSIIDLQPLLGWNRLWGVHHATESCTIDQAGVKLKEAGYVH